MCEPILLGEAEGSEGRLGKDMKTRILRRAREEPSDTGPGLWGQPVEWV